MKKFIYCFIAIIICFMCSSCMDTDEGYMSLKEYNKIYMNRLETIYVMCPDSLGNVSVIKYENIMHKDIIIRETYIVFPDKDGHYVTYVNCPIKIEN